MRSVLAVAALLVVGGCGSADIVVTGEPGTPAYDGPMSVARDPDAPDLMARAGAAGRALECDGRAYNGGGADYDGGLESVQDSPEGALEDLFREEGVGWGMPTSGYRVERRDDGRVLFSYDVDGRTKADYVVADGVRDWKDHVGWGVESWAQCDPAEFPAEFTDDLDLEVWTDASGARVPVSTVTSWPGPEHCDWQDIRFLEIGSDASRPADEEYLRDTRGELAESLRGTFDARARLPEDAIDTGWRRDGRELWRVPDRSAAYLVSLTDPADVERWPASKEPIGCA